MIASRRHNGFTLIEVMVVVAIVAILAAIAIPSYAAFIQRSNRSEARNALLEAAVWMERWRTERGLYGNAPATPTVAPATFPFTQTPSAPAAAKYTIAPPTIAALGIGYLITASPTGAMAGDLCGDLTIDHSGARGFTGASPPATQDICWNR